MVQRADNVSDFSELVGMQEGGWLQQYQVAGEVVQKPISEYKKQFEDEIKDLPSWYERNREKIKSTVPSEYLQSPDLPFNFPKIYPTFNEEDNPSPSAQGVPNYYKALYAKGLDNRINISNQDESYLGIWANRGLTRVGY